MFVAVLMTDPAAPGLERTTVESLRNAWGGGDARWLQPGWRRNFPSLQCLRTAGRSGRICRR